MVDMVSVPTKKNGSGRKDKLLADDGGSILNGLNADDMLMGSIGDDTLNGGNGRDTLNGGAGINVLTGGAGNDTFVIDAALENAFSTITDFEGTVTRKLKKVFHDTLSITGADGKDILLVQNDGSVDVYVGVDKVAEILNADASTVFASTVLTGEAASFAIGDGPPDANHDPVATAEVYNLSEGGYFGTGFNVTDADGDTLTYSLVGEGVPGVQFFSEGGFIYDGSDPFFNSIPTGETQSFTLTYLVEDGKGGSATSTATFNITGTLAPPVVPWISDVFLSEGTGVVSGTLADFVTDEDSDTLTYNLSFPDETPGAFKLNQDGSWTFDSNDPAYAYLKTGESGVVSIVYNVDDGEGGNSFGYLFVNIAGVNQAPVASPGSTTLDEDDGVFTAELLNGVSDPDGDALTFSQFFASDDQTAPGFTMDADGNVSIDTHDAAFDDIPDGETQTFVAHYRVEDGNGGSAESTFSYTIKGQADPNEAPVTTPQTADLTENTGSQFGDLALLTTDSDSPSLNLTFTQSGDEVSGFKLNSDGTWAFDTDASAYDYLNNGESSQLVVNYYVEDGEGGLTNDTLTINLEGQTDEGENIAPDGGTDSLRYFYPASLVIRTGDLHDQTYDPDSPAGSLSFVADQAYEGFTLNLDGTWAFDLRSFSDDDMVNGRRDLAVGFTVTDDHGATGVGVLTIAEVFVFDG